MSYAIATSAELIEIAFSGDLRIAEAVDGFEALGAADPGTAKRAIIDLTRLDSLELTVEDSHRLSRSNRLLFPWDSDYRVAVAALSAGVVTEAQSFLVVRDLMTGRTESQLPVFRIFETVAEARSWVTSDTQTENG